MASTFNAFESLMGAGETVSTGKKKSKAKNKNKGSGNQPEQPKPAQQASAPGTAAEAKPAASEPVAVADAVAKLELAARTAVSSGDRAKLWRDWCRQAVEGPSAQAYQGASGSRMSFKQVVLDSKVLEITAELAISHPLNQQHEDQLDRLFNTFLPVDGRQSSYLAAAVSKLSHLLADGAPDSVGAAQRAAQNVVRHFKRTPAQVANGSGGSDSASAWLQRLKKIDTTIGNELTVLQKLSQASGAVVTKERVQCALSILKLQEERVELLKPGSVPSVQRSAGSGNPALKALQELHAVVLNHVQEAEAMEASARSNAAYAQAQFASSHAAVQREELLLSKQAAELAGQISTLEAQLQAVRLQAAEVEQRRSMLKKQGKPAASNGTGAARKQQPAKSAADYKQQLAVVDDLLNLVDPHRHTAVSAEQIWEAQAGQQVAVGEYIDFARQCLDMNLALLAETPQKINFSKQRISQAEKLLALTAANVKNQDANKKQKEEAEKLLAETMKTAEGVIVQSEDITRSVSSRHRTFASADPAGAASLAAEVNQVEELYAKIGRQYTNVMMCYDQAPLKVTPAPRAPRANAQRRGDAAATPSPADAPVPAVAKPSPAPAAPAAAAAPAPKPVAKAPAPVPTSTRSWNKPQQAAPAADEDASLPTPAEAFRGAESSDGFHTVSGGRKNRMKA